MIATEKMSDCIKEDGQFLRAVVKYLQSTNSELKGSEMEDEVSFFTGVRDACDYQLKVLNEYGE